MKRKSLLFIALMLFVSVVCEAGKVIRVLAIGNSFSEDAVEQYLYELALAQGDSLIIGNAYIGGCSIDRHWDNSQTGKADYGYRKIVDGKMVTQPHVTLERAIKDDDWDIISLQQASHFSGLPETYGHLADLKRYVMATATNKNVEIVFHMTWAYAKDSSHGGFKNYGNDQQQMYRMILSAVNKAIEQTGIKRVIPSGVAIQNARETMGDVLNRDGFHLQLTYGRYTAACTWCEFLTGKNVVGNPYKPDTIDDHTARLAQEAAHKAMKMSRRLFK
ncbi:DUF4886 domain-containing protein [Hoylesella oralis]|uniref:DUF4886 domain-containing protein n=1 Tax=Hoylesella oralis TaxID=28134 RepID=UPI0036095EE6